VCIPSEKVKSRTATSSDIRQTAVVAAADDIAIVVGRHNIIIILLLLYGGVYQPVIAVFEYDYATVD